MICWAGQWIQTPSTSHFQAKEWNAHFWITFNFWWSARLVDGLKPHLQPLSNQKNDMLIFGLRSTSYDWPGWPMDSNPICNPSPTKKPLPWNAHFWITFNFWWSASSTSDDWPGWSKDSNPICNLSPTKKMKCSFLYYVQILVISLAGQWTRTPFATLLQQKKWNACFVLCYSSDDQPGWLMDSIHHRSPAKGMKCSFLDYVQLLDDWPGWSMDSNPICYPSPAKKMKC